MIVFQMLLWNLFCTHESGKQCKVISFTMNDSFQLMEKTHQVSGLTPEEMKQTKIEFYLEALPSKKLTVNTAWHSLDISPSDSFYGIRENSVTCPSSGQKLDCAVPFGYSGVGLAFAFEGKHHWCRSKGYKPSTKNPGTYDIYFTEKHCPSVN